MKTYVLDACALIAYINDEKGADVVEALLAGKNHVVVSIINVYEVYYDALRTSGEEKANSILEDIEGLPIKIIRNISKKAILEAAKFKVNYSISLADSIVLGLAVLLNAFIVTSDHHEFDVIEEKDSLNFHWIR